MLVVPALVVWYFPFSIGWPPARAEGTGAGGSWGQSGWGLGPHLPEDHLEALAHEDFHAFGNPEGEAHQGEYGSPGGLHAIAPAAHLLAVHPQHPGEGGPGEAAGLLEPDQPLGEVLGEHGALQGQHAALDDDADRAPVDTGLVVMDRHRLPPV